MGNTPVLALGSATDEVIPFVESCEEDGTR
jgi:hypothetical protein